MDWEMESKYTITTAREKIYFSWGVLLHLREMILIDSLNQMSITMAISLKLRTI
jgi:hypothetical protein